MSNTTAANWIVSDLLRKEAEEAGFSVTHQYGTEFLITPIPAKHPQFNESPMYRAGSVEECRSWLNGYRQGAFYASYTKRGPDLTSKSKKSK